MKKEKNKFAVALAAKRWANKTKKQKADHIRMMNAARLKKQGRELYT